MAKHMETNGSEMTFPEHTKYDEKVLKKIIASALVNVDGFLGTTEGGLTLALHKSENEEEEILRGISAGMKHNHKVVVSVKAIVEDGKNIPAIVEAIDTEAVRALREVGGVETKAVNVEVADSMTRAAYEAKYIKHAKVKAGK